MPFSAAIVGVGENDDDFALMNILDADATILTDVNGNKAVRDIV